MAGTSSLLKSAASIRNQLATYQDSLMAYDYSQSAYTDSAFSQYSAYLQSRIAQESNTPSIAAASRALSLTKALTGAMKSNVSATIQRENIQVLSGNATLTDKYNIISQQFVRAQANGDLTLAQSLEGQSYTLSKQIQYQQQQSYTAQAANDGKSWALTAKDFEASLKQFNTDYVNAGRTSAQSIAADFVKQMEPQLAKAGIYNVQPNYFDIVDGINRAIYNSYSNAATVIAPYDTTGAAAQGYADKANTAVNTIHTIYGDMNAQQLAQAQANPQMYSYKEDPQFVSKNPNDASGSLNPQTGYSYSSGNVIAPTFAKTPMITIAPTINNQIQALKLNVVSKPADGNGIEVTTSADSPAWIQKILPGDATAHILSDAADTSGKSTLQFEADSQSGTGKAVYTFAKDGTVWESSNLGDKLINGTPPVPPMSVMGTIGAAFQYGARQVELLLGTPKAFAATVPGMVQNGTNHFTLPPLPVAKPLQLPSLNVAPPQAQPALTAKPAINPYPAAPTVSPQTTAPSTAIQGGSSGIQLQGGGMSLQGGGGGGISL
jgi:hypothetical protein